MTNLRRQPRVRLAHCNFSQGTQVRGSSGGAARTRDKRPKCAQGPAWIFIEIDWVVLCCGARLLVIDVDCVDVCRNLFFFISIEFCSLLFLSLLLSLGCGQLRDGNGNVLRGYAWLCIMKIVPVDSFQLRPETAPNLTKPGRRIAVLDQSLQARVISVIHTVPQIRQPPMRIVEASNRTRQADWLSDRGRCVRIQWFMDPSSDPLVDPWIAAACQSVNLCVWRAE